MANLFFPQLSSGALAQYPIRKTRMTRTVANALQDGSMILYSDPNASKLMWQLGYVGLSQRDLTALVDHFTACQGRLQPFTFIDPTDNMLADSANLLSSCWNCSSSLQVLANQTDPNGGLAAFSATNNGQLNLQLAQTLAVPANYQYCFSLYVQSAQPTLIELVRTGQTNQQTTKVGVGPQWARVISSGQLSDQDTSFSVAISLAPGQQISLYGPQLEAQISPSRYRPTVQVGGVYANAHWGVDELPVSADGPNLFSTAFSIETAI